MIKHSVKNDLIHLSIDNLDFSYRIPLIKLGKAIDWKIGEKGTKGIVIQNVSAWTLQLFTKKITEDKYIKQFKEIVQENSEKNTVNWEDTFLAVNIQNEYNWLTTKDKSDQKISEDEIVSTLKKKYKLD